MKKLTKQQTYLLQMGIQLIKNNKSNGLSHSQMEDIKLIMDNLIPNTKQKSTLMDKLTDIYYS